MAELSEWQVQVMINDQIEAYDAKAQEFRRGIHNQLDRIQASINETSGAKKFAGWVIPLIISILLLVKEYIAHAK